MAVKTSIDHRRKIRALEAKRDALLGNAAKNKTDLAKVRAELKAVRKQGAK